LISTETKHPQYKVTNLITVEFFLFIKPYRSQYMLKTSFTWIKERTHTSDHGLSHRFEDLVDRYEWSGRHQQSVNSSSIFSFSFGAEYNGGFKCPHKKNLRGSGWSKLGLQHIRYTLYTLYCICMCVWVCCQTGGKLWEEYTKEEKSTRYVYYYSSILLQQYSSECIQGSDQNSKLPYSVVELLIIALLICSLYAQLQKRHFLGPQGKGYHSPNQAPLFITAASPASKCTSI
jgi:hypothetical protein